MVEKISLNPLTRQIGLMEIEVEVEGRRVVEARCGGLIFRGLEAIMRGRAPADAPYLLERVCGICSTAHALAATEALESMAEVEVPRNAILIRNLTFAADEVQNHLRHFYFFVLPDYVKTLFLEKGSKPSGDWRFSSAEENRLAEHYFRAMEMSSMAHAMVGVFGARAPHQRGIVPGGVTAGPDADRIRRFRSLWREVKSFVDHVFLPDVETLARVYADYYHLGAGPRALLAAGKYRTPDGKGTYFAGGFLPEALEGKDRPEPVEPDKISEDASHAWFKEEKPFAPDPDRPVAYSWIKAPRYKGQVVQTGPLASLWMAGRYRRGISTMDRLVARALVAQLDCQLMGEWLAELDPAAPFHRPYSPPPSGKGQALVEVMRGMLLHSLQIEGGQVLSYNIITPSTWNYSSRDAQGRRGAVEEALIGLPVANPQQPVEVGRVVRSFDTCSACAAQVIVAGRRLAPVEL